MVESTYTQGAAGQKLTTATLPVLPPLSEDITMTVGVVGGNVQISWEPTGGTLETTTDVGDPASWTAVPGATSPYTATPTGNAYFRVRN